ncbi:MAG: prolyl-tRNA synthetase associated domain-containing protein [Clostridia bacterium]|nr:prolyl-tRNA synthetase associated domain-containing protein [Clostridia bacterium]
MVLYKGRPSSNEGRLPREIRVYDFLDSLGIEYYRVDHDSIFGDGECEAVERVLDNVICKNIFLCNRQRTAYYMLVMPAHKRFVTSQVSHLLNSSRLSFGSAEDMLELLDVTPGSVSIMALMNDRENRVQLVIDDELLRYEDFGCHPCMNTSSLRLKRADVFDKFLTAVNHKPIFLTLNQEQ